METIRFGLIGKEDIKFGRSSFEATLADGRTVSLSELNLDAFDGLFSLDDATTNDITTLLTLRHTTTGTPAASLGTRLRFQGESADETPSDLGALEFAFDDVTATSEDSTAYLLLRRAGAAISRGYGFRNTGDFNLLFSAALTAARTVTIPDATDTLVNLTSTQTLSAKTLTDSLHNAGSGTETFRPNGHIDVKVTAVSTDANTTEKDLQTYSLPANSLSANGRAVRIKAWGGTAINANTKTIRLYWGASVVASNNISQAPNSQAWILEAFIVRTGALTQDAIGEGRVGSVQQSVSMQAVNETLSSAITIKVTGQNGTATAADINAEGMSVEYING